MRLTTKIGICQIAPIMFFLFYFVQVGFGYDTIKNIPVPSGYERIRYDKKSYSHYLQSLPLKEKNTIYKWNGKKVFGVLYNIYAVVDKPLLFKSDLEQCADFCMRFWADFHKNLNKLDKLYLYNYSGKKKYYKRSNKIYKSFLRWHMAYSNSYSIKKGANKVETRALKPGDMFVQNEAPRRKRAGYQSGIKTNLDDGGKRSFPPHPLSACLPHRKRMGYKKS